jgi:hypothetical protein
MPPFWQRQSTCMGVPQAVSWRYGSMSCGASHFDFCIIIHACLSVLHCFLRCRQCLAAISCISHLSITLIIASLPPPISTLESFHDHLPFRFFFRNDQICAVKGSYMGAESPVFRLYILPVPMGGAHRIKSPAACYYLLFVIYLSKCMHILRSKIISPLFLLPLIATVIFIPYHQKVETGLLVNELEKRGVSLVFNYSACSLMLPCFEFSNATLADSRRDLAFRNFVCPEILINISLLRYFLGVMFFSDGRYNSSRLSSW